MGDTTSSGGGFLGLSDDALRNLGAFGAQMSIAANARTPQGFLQYGQGGAGPLGAGVMASLEQDRINRQLTAQLGLTGAQTANIGAEAQTRQLANIMTAMQMPLAQAGIQQGLQQMNNPALWGGMGAMPAPPGGAPAPASGGPEAGNVIPPAQRQLILQQAEKDANVPARVIDAHVAQETGWRQTGVPNEVGAGGLMQIKRTTAEQPGFGLQPMDFQRILHEPQYAVTQGARYLAAVARARGVTDWTNPEQVAQAAAGYYKPTANPMARDAADYASQVVGRWRKGFSWEQPAVVAAADEQGGGPQSGPGGMTLPQGGGGIDPTLFAQYQRERAQGMAQVGSVIPMISERGKALLAQAEKTRELAYGPWMEGAKEAAKAPYDVWAARMKPQTTRAATSLFNPQTGQWETHRQPEWRDVVDPKTGQKFPASLTENDDHTMTITGGYPGMPPGVMPPSTLAPAELEAQTEAGRSSQDEKERSQYAAAQSSLFSLTKMQHDFETLNNTPGAWSKTGDLAETKLNFARFINSSLQSMGIEPGFNPEKVGAGEDLIKLTKTAGMQLLNSTFGASREAASTILSSTAAVPGLANTPFGAMAVLNGMREIARMNIDRRHYMLDWMRKYKTLPGAEERFFTERPAALYAQRAISMVQPVQLNLPGAVDDFLKTKPLPGTKVVMPGGQIGTVPGVEDIPAPAAPADTQ